MTQEDRHKPKHGSLKPLEAELRRLPELEVPEALEAKLLAGIPSGRPAAASGRRPRWLGLAWSFAAAAVAAGLIMAVMTFWPAGPPERPGTFTTSAIQIRPIYVLGDRITTHSKETRPCDVLPALPNWH